jgi:hypothetical protein
MTDPIPDLEILLWKLLGQAPDDYSPEASKVNFLLEVMRGYGDGMYNLSEVLTIFHRYPIPGFDVLLWIESKVAEGVYAPEEEED